MLTLQWSESLALGLPAMDATHHEFVDLLARVVDASDAELLPLWQELVDHTDDHFAREDHWMRDTGFSSTNCHTTQHQVVLQVMREGSKRGRAGQLEVVRQMADELSMWFPQHAQAMDAALALHLRSVGYNVHTGLVELPEAMPKAPIEGCHSELCREEAEVHA
jgi:hemerythrin-like metal-binding protein